MSKSPPSPTAPRARPSPRRLVLLLGVWAIAAGAAILIALALDSPVGEGARDAARPTPPGEVATSGSDEAVAPDDLPPLALVLDRPPPGGIGRLPPARAVDRLRTLAVEGAPPRRFVELGAALQLVGDAAGARDAYLEALGIAPDDVAAQVGLALTAGAMGEAGLELAAAELERLARERPRDQLVAFNQGWLALYRGQADQVERAWARTAALDPASRLGQTARMFSRALETARSGRRP